jgi:hypothetical protein
VSDRKTQVADHGLVTKIDREMVDFKQRSHGPRLQHWL